ncbi:hypothetical protein MIND_00389200 [Mycena indigotica]|uniref:Uncharacterized protein n=1 Tax=Mycena indigotica TaxID=2126181 RepID=A0A8H6WCW1_9AGAR|nr:uncharacterized protein MIND_00389200 [Mycena indigotica]KAF7310158.1 hypothetical protein MIND_00389200 [Mycena indigotica]
MKDKLDTRTLRPRRPLAKKAAAASSNAVPDDDGPGRRGTRCQLARPDRAKARFLYHQCDLGMHDIALVLKSTEGVVGGAVRNRYKVPDNELDDELYLDEAFKRTYLHFKDDVEVLPGVEGGEGHSRMRRFSDSPLSEYNYDLPDFDYGDKTLVRKSSPEAPSKSAGSPMSDSHAPSSPPSHFFGALDDPLPRSTSPLFSPLPSPDPPDALVEFLAHDISPHLSLLHHCGLFRLVGISMPELTAMAAWTRAEVVETLDRLLTTWPIPESHPVPIAHDGLTAFERIALANAVGTIPVDEPDALAPVMPQTIEDFIERPMPGLPAGVSLQHHHDLIFLTGLKTVDELSTMAGWTDTRVRDALATMYWGSMSPFELVLFELGVRRLRQA